MHQFLMALLWLFMPDARCRKSDVSTVSAGTAGRKTGRSRPGIVMEELYNNKYVSTTMSQQQCILLIQAVSRILRDEAEKQDLIFSLEVKPKKIE
ncbi:hypothetical protein [Litoribacter populi]|uniref:hypothetical protein n=1 Tax=Litoribacter populi TaxID=2598460 RepID=UPI0011810C56|nr:hypothetical protein [Litoribacter populi]